MMKRRCGILMPISSLPGGYGIGSLGKPARDFVDFCAAAGQEVWQILPVGPTGYGDSPYQSCSAFAGSPYLIDLDLLAEDGLLTKADLAQAAAPKPQPAAPAAKSLWPTKAEKPAPAPQPDPTRVDYEDLYNRRFLLLRRAYAAWKKQRPVPGYDTPYSDEFYAFTLRSDAWLPDYALYMAIKGANGMKSWQEWPAPLRTHTPAALAAFAAAEADEIDFWRFLQFEFDRQWQRLHQYAKKNGVRIMGDIPFYVAADSADAWAGAPLFEMNADGSPRRVAGCPPDYFSADGQLWGNPLYDWTRQKADGFRWWVLRIRHSLRLFDLLRIDHFRAFDTYWAIPAGDKTARGGKWEQGPGMELFHTLAEKLGELPIVAEDLGQMFDSVRELLANSGFPGMKVLQFAFDGKDGEYLPHNYGKNCVAYPGTHDNPTLTDWFENHATPAEKALALAYIGAEEGADPTAATIRTVLGSPAALAVIPAQDWLGLGAEARLNMPGSLGGNWAWRAAPGSFSAPLAAHLRACVAASYRLAPDLSKSVK